MEFNTIILRFRDLVTEENGTIQRHQEIIKNKNFVWWGWWNKGNEKVPFDEFAVLKQKMKETLDLFLMKIFYSPKWEMAVLKQVKSLLMI